MTRHIYISILYIILVTLPMCSTEAINHSADFTPGWWRGWFCEDVPDGKTETISKKADFCLEKELEYLYLNTVYFDIKRSGEPVSQMAEKCREHSAAMIGRNGHRIVLEQLYEYYLAGEHTGPATKFASNFLNLEKKEKEVFKKIRLIDCRFIYKSKCGWLYFKKKNKQRCPKAVESDSGYCQCQVSIHYPRGQKYFNTIIHKAWP